MVTFKLGKNPQKQRRKRLDDVRLPMIGMTEFVKIAGRYSHIPAKIDTGADTSSIWVSNLTVTDDGALEFTLFGPESKFYDGHVFHFENGSFVVKALMNSTGDKHYRYQVHLPLKIGGKNIRAAFTLADRSRNGMPILIGRRTISNKFLVDVTLNPTGRRPRFKAEAERLTAELKRDPKSFHRKYRLGLHSKKSPEPSSDDASKSLSETNPANKSPKLNKGNPTPDKDNSV